MYRSLWPLPEEESMDALSTITLWGYQETLEELKNKLWGTICELEEVKANARDEIKKKEESINELLHLLKAANLERDEAKNQLQIVLDKLAPPNSGELFPSPPFLQPESPQLRQALGSSSLTESENLTDGHNNVSSPTVVDSISGEFLPADSAEDEVMKALFERFGKKPLPEKGRFLKAVIDAGPILDTLFVAGSLPRWRNPPPLKPLLVPPLSIRSEESLNCGVGGSMGTAMGYYGGNGGLCNGVKRPVLEQSGGSQDCFAVKRQKSQ